MAHPATQLDFFQTFYATEHGRKVMVWMEDNVDKLTADNVDSAVGICMIRNLINQIKEAAGLTTEMRIAMEAQAASLSNQNEKKPETETNLLET